MTLQLGGPIPCWHVSPSLLLLLLLLLFVLRDNFDTVQGVFELLFQDFKHALRDNFVTLQGVFELMFQDCKHTLRDNFCSNAP